MRTRWRWDFEDDQRGGAGSPRRPEQPAQAPPPAPRQPSPPDRQAQIRRRRTTAGMALAVLVVVIAAVAAAAGSRHGGGTASGRLAHPHAARAAAPPPLPENDQNAAVAAVLGYTPFVKEGGGDGREIALTFDDGPGPYTPQLLDVLERTHVRATFFAIGRMLQYFGASTAREIRDGDVIGDHTETHPEMARLSARDQHEELFEQIARVELLGGSRPVLFRPPYGSFNSTTMRELHTLKLLMVLWSVDTDDYEQPGAEAIVQRALQGAHPGAIVLMHDAGGTRTQTIAALPIIISRLRAEHYRLVTVPQLLKDDPPPPGLPLPASLAGD
jgi:peptidoglycan/xylan/chitin deacetylase (PgdA/CDA1 family)